MLSATCMNVSSLGRGKFGINSEKTSLFLNVCKVICSKKMLPNSLANVIVSFCLQVTTGTAMKMETVVMVLGPRRSSMAARTLLLSKE